MNRHCGDFTDGLHIPDLTEQFFFCINMVGMFCQESQQIKLFCGKLLLFSIDPDSSGRFVYFDTADFDDIIFGMALPIRRS